MAKRWYYKVGEEVVGPVDDGQLKSAVEAGVLKPTSRLRLGETGAWAQASIMGKLFEPQTPIEIDDDLLPVSKLATNIQADRSEATLRPAGPLNLRPQAKPKNVGPFTPTNLAVGGAALAAVIVVSLLVLLVAADDEQSAPEAASIVTAESVKKPTTQASVKPTIKAPTSKLPSSLGTVSSGIGDAEKDLKDPLFLSDVKPLHYEVLTLHAGFGFGVNGRFMDGDVQHTITLAGQKSPRGILAHPKSFGVSRVVFNMRGKPYKQFLATIGVDDVRQNGPRSSLVFEVLGDGRVLWQSKPVVRWGQPQACSVKLPELTKLELRVSCPGDAIDAFAVWCEARLTNKDIGPDENTWAPAWPDTPTGPTGVVATVPMAGAPVPTSQVPTPQTPTSVAPSPGELTLPSGEPIDLGPAVLTKEGVRELFLSNANRPAKRKAKNELSAHFQVTDGLVTYNNEGELHGPALVLSKSRKPKMLVWFANSRRDGLLRYWNDDGQIELVSAYKNGAKRGVTTVYVAGQPRLVEEWNANQTISRYYIDHEDKGPSLVDIGKLNADARKIMRAAELRMEMVEIALTDAERKWKQSLRSWWRDNDAEIKRMNRGIASAKDRDSRDAWAQKVREKLASLQEESDRARDAFLSSF